MAGRIGEHFSYVRSRRKPESDADCCLRGKWRSIEEQRGGRYSLRHIARPKGRHLSPVLAMPHAVVKGLRFEGGVVEQKRIRSS